MCIVDFCIIYHNFVLNHQLGKQWIKIAASKVKIQETDFPKITHVTQALN